MDSLNQDLFGERDRILKIVDSLYFNELRDVLSETILGAVVINPRENRMFFSDSVSKVIGFAATQDVLLDSFLQYVPEYERDVVAQKYDNAIREMILADKQFESISHSIRKNEFSIYDVEVRLQVIADENQAKYLAGVMIDRTRSVKEQSFDQLFGEGSNGYFFCYDITENKCRVSQKFVEDFDLLSDTLENFSENFLMYVYPDDVDIIKGAFEDFLRTHTNPERGIVFRTLAPAKGEICMRISGFSDAGSDGKLGGNVRYVSFECVDVTEYVQNESMRDQLIDGSSAVTFYADVTNGYLYFSENIREIFPGARTEIAGDIVEEIATRVSSEDSKRLRNTLHKVARELDSKFAVEFRISVNERRNVWIACRGKSYFDTGRNAKAIVGALFDLTSMNEVKENVEKNNTCNAITGLPQRDKLLNDAAKVLRKTDILSAALVLIDLNEFKQFNDRYGHTLANELLISMASILNNSKPEGSSLYHIGIDTFALLWPEASQVKVTEYMNSVQERGSQPFEIGDGEYFVNFSLSAAFYPLSTTVDELLINAEIALHKVKQNKKMKFAVYSPVDKNELKERLDFEMHITQCIRNNMENFQLYYQPLIDAKTGKLNGAEALLRWQSANGELVNPEKVVAALESTDQMGAVSDWILDQAISQCAEWIRHGAPQDFYVHINATADDLTKGGYADTVKDVLATHNLGPENILIEITETSLVKNIGVCRKNLNALKRANIKSALDDFGSGYSSFNYLKELPVDEIKIDKSFVDDMDTVEFNRSFISAITMLAHSIDKKVVVEGVETESQMTAIRDMGADIFQGYYFGKPMSVFAFTNKYFNQ